jgi:hypothetical protein
MELADVAIRKVHPTSTGRLMAFKFSQLHLGCFFFFFVSAFGVSAFWIKFFESDIAQPIDAS